MKNLILRGVFLFATAATLAGCTNPTPRYDANFGDSISDLQKMQVLNPAADHNTAIPTGIDGKSAYSAYDQYQKSFKAPEPKTNVFTIGVGR